MKTVFSNILGDMFPCGNGDEIEHNLVCDGTDDCPEGELWKGLWWNIRCFTLAVMHK